MKHLAIDGRANEDRAVEHSKISSDRIGKLDKQDTCGWARAPDMATSAGAHAPLDPAGVVGEPRAAVGQGHRAWVPSDPNQRVENNCSSSSSSKLFSTSQSSTTSLGLFPCVIIVQFVASLWCLFLWSSFLNHWHRNG